MEDYNTVAYDITGSDLSMTIDTVNPIIGDALTVHFDEIQKAGTYISVRIWYSTQPSA